MDTIQIEIPTDWTDYELLDSGAGKKLERFGTYRVNRPDPRALWQPHLPQESWKLIDAIYTNNPNRGGEWQFINPPPEKLHIHYKHMTFALKPTEFKHMGIFPEQAVNWNWLTRVINKKPLNILNLFAYTGGATIAASLAGANVTHVDSVKSTNTWAKENTQLSGVRTESLRFIEEDALKFVLREGRRGNHYDGIIMDPPRFGRGSKGEVWKLENQLPELLTACQEILADKPTFFLLNAYTADLSSIVIHHMLNQTMKKFHGNTTSGELALQASSDLRILPNGIFARWQSE